MAWLQGEHGEFATQPSALEPVCLQHLVFAGSPKLDRSEEPEVLQAVAFQ